MSRIHSNFASGTLGASLAPGDTTITFGVAPPFATLAASDIVPITLDPVTPGSQEIIWLTAYTSGGTTGTIARGKEGTSATTHGPSAAWVQAPTTVDMPPGWFNALAYG